PKENPKEPKLKFTYKESKEYETIESEIAQLEQQFANLEEEMVPAGKMLLLICSGNN
ncbi:MAG: hypothetical protein J6J07_05390, partial [Oscillospiraceae bacterium]|nr:hypothetical protein [Oscillospiraceae bacterium]